MTLLASEPTHRGPAGPMATGRSRALDIFRGATVAMMILVNNPGSWQHLYAPLDHAAWHGCTPTDLVFPFFLFAVGNALAFVMARLQPGAAAAQWTPDARRVFWTRIARRTLLIFAIGLFLNASPFVRWDAGGELVLRSWDTLRTMGVLQRIALCFGCAAAVVGLASKQHVPWIAALLLLGYWLACVGLGDRADQYSLQGWFGTALDRAVLGQSHLYRGEGVPFDPEGLASTAPAVAQVLLGWWVGDMVRSNAGPGSALGARLFVRAVPLLVLAYLWQLQMPFNKKIWTSSYVLLTTGLAMAALATLIHAVDGRQRAAGGGGWAGAAGRFVQGFFEVFGKNALFVFVLSGFIPRVLALLRWQDGRNADGTLHWLTPLPWLYQTLFAGIGNDPRIGSLAYACATLAFYALIAWALDRRGLYVRV